MSSRTLELAEQPASVSWRTDWRLMLAFGGALLVIIAYLLPMFPYRITQAQTLFSKGTRVNLDFPVLINGQHYAQGVLPRDEVLQGVEITVRPIEPGRGSGWGELLTAALRASAAPFTLLSYLLCLLLPVIVTLFALAFVGVAWIGKRSLPEALVPALINISFVAPFALLFAWHHQFDFSSRLLALDRAALAPRIGFWLAMAGSLAVFGSALSLRRETQRRVVTWWALVFAVAISIWLLVRFRPYPFLEIWLFVADGILVTLRLVFTSFGFILLVSLLGGLGRISKSPIIYSISSLYVELIRGIPLLVQLLFIWFALPQVFDVVGEALQGSAALAGIGDWLVGLRLSPFTAAVMGFTICYGAYGSEIFRAGISSIHLGQMEAARSLGMTYVQAMWHIILPQAVRVILPPIGNEFVALLKDSSLVSVLAVSDLTRRGREYMARTFLSFDTWILVALCYLVLTLFSSRAVEFIESKSRFER